MLYGCSIGSDGWLFLLRVHLAICKFTLYLIEWDVTGLGVETIYELFQTALRTLSLY